MKTVLCRTSWEPCGRISARCIGHRGGLSARRDPAAGGARGLQLRNGVFTRIHLPGAQGTDAWDINDDGVIVGRYTDKKGRTRGFKAKPVN